MQARRALQIVSKKRSFSQIKKMSRKESLLKVLEKPRKVLKASEVTRCLEELQGGGLPKSVAAEMLFASLQVKLGNAMPMQSEPEKSVFEKEKWDGEEREAEAIQELENKLGRDSFLGKPMPEPPDFPEKKKKPQARERFPEPIFLKSEKILSDKSATDTTTATTTKLKTTFTPGKFRKQRENQIKSPKQIKETYITAMQRCLDLPKADSQDIATEILDIMQTNDVEPSREFYTEGFRVFHRAADWKSCLRLLTEMEVRHDITPTAWNFALAYDSLVQGGETLKGEAVLKQMKKRLGTKVVDEVRRAVVPNGGLSVEFLERYAKENQELSFKEELILEQGWWSGLEGYLEEEAVLKEEVLPYDPFLSKVPKEEGETEELSEDKREEWDGVLKGWLGHY